LRDAAEFSPDGTRLAVADPRCGRLLDAATGEPTAWRRSDGRVGEIALQIVLRMAVERG
jgi:hypothetical protein